MLLAAQYIVSRLFIAKLCEMCASAMVFEPATIGNFSSIKKVEYLSLGVKKKLK